MQTQEYGDIKENLDVRHPFLCCGSHDFYLQFPYLFCFLKMKNSNSDRSLME